MLKVVEVIAAVSLLFFFFIISFYDQRFSSNFKKMASAVFVFVVLIIISLKNFGLDLENYQEIYKIVSLSTWGSVIKSDWEPLFVLFAKLSDVLGLGFGSFFFLWYFFPCVIILKISFEYSSRPLLAVSLFFLLYFFSFMDASRHFAAACYYLLGVHFFVSKRKLVGFAYFSLSFFSHFSALIFLICVFVRKSLFSRPAYLALIVFFGIAAFILKPLLISFIISYNLQEVHVIFWKLNYYLTYYNSVGYEFQGWSHKILWNTIIYAHVVMVVVINFYMLGTRFKSSLNLFERALLGSQVFGSLLFFGFASVGAITLGVRVNFMMSIGVFILISNLLDVRFGRASIGLYLLVLILIIIANFFYVLYLSGLHIKQSPIYIGF